MKVLRMNIELAKREELKSAKKQSNDMIVSVVYPNTYPALNVLVIALGYVTLKDTEAVTVWT